MTKLTLPKNLAAAACVGAITVLAACGGSSTLSRADFLAKADAICRDGQGSFHAIQATSPNNGAEAAAQTGKLVSVSEAEMRQLRALRPPTSLSSAFDVYLKAREDAIAILRKGQAAAKRNDAQGYASAKDEVAAGQPRRFDLSRKVGFSVCSKPELRAPGAAATKKPAH